MQMQKQIYHVFVALTELLLAVIREHIAFLTKPTKNRKRVRNIRWMMENKNNGNPKTPENF